MNISLIAFLSLIILVSGCVSPSILTPEQVLESDSFLNQEVVVKGKAYVGPSICTLIFCDEDNPCCNSCVGKLVLKGESQQIEIRGLDAGCSGNDCSQTCHPLEKEKEYIVSGIWKEESGEYFIELGSFEEAR